ncbi:MAG TPA: hypothetical protein VJ547_12020 [Candidatus Thermoplasmatota archaeon]|nr:hypothetical protein [Candidatus Thermoplasmatota archaeon]
MGDRCEACGQRIRKLNPHQMDKTKVRVLEAIARHNLVGAVWVKVLADPAAAGARAGTPHLVTDEVHVARLRWFGLVETSVRRSGLYRATPLGIAFLRGTASVPAKIWCREGKVADESPDRVFVRDVRGVLLDKTFWDGYPAVQREAEDKKRDLPLFNYA